MEKKRSVISRVTLNTPTFNDITFYPTYINLFFGGNGVGKSSAAKAIRNGSGVEWRVGESQENYQILLFDQDFIERNFASYDYLPGVFMVGESNINIQKDLDALDLEKKQITEEMARLIAVGNQKKRSGEELLIVLQEECWRKTADIRQNFEKTQSGRKRKNTFTDKILETSPRMHDLAKLKDLYDIAYDANAQTYDLFRKSGNISGRYDLSGEILMEKPVISSSDTHFAVFMRAIGATDWVKNGHAHYVKNAGGKCPFCQQTLPEYFEGEIAACFDEQYQNDQSALAEFQMAYKSWTKSVLDIFRANMVGAFPKLPLTLYHEKVDRLQTMIQANMRLIERKLEKPADEIRLEDVKSLIQEIDQMIDGFNAQIRENNEVVSEKRIRKKECEKEVWEHLASILADEVTEYRQASEKVKMELSALGNQYKNKKERSIWLSSEIRRVGSQTTGTRWAIDGINQLLENSGFQGFRIRERADISDTYEIVREDGRPAVSLSEGEKSFIAFLYFYYLAKGSGQAALSGVDTLKGTQPAVDHREKIVLIDDPGSGLDDQALFIVSSLVGELIEGCYENSCHIEKSRKGMELRQLFIFTHNTHFHRQISSQLVSRYACASFFMIRKIRNASSIEECINSPVNGQGLPTNRNPVQSAYTALWEEYRVLNHTIPLLNVTRRILEEYLIRLCGYRETDVKKTVLADHKEDLIIRCENGQKNYSMLQIATEMLCRIGQREDFPGGVSLTEDHVDAGLYKQVFEKIFEFMGQKQHYDRMSGKA